MHTSSRLTVDGRFAIIPHWILDADLSSGAIHLYAVLRRYADGRTGDAFPSRSTLARDLGKSSRRTIDGYLAELRRAGALTVTQRKKPGTQQNQTSIYHLVTLPPVQQNAPPRAVDCSENYTHSTTPTSPIATTVPAVPRSSLRSPSPSGSTDTRSHLLPLVRDIAESSDTNHEAASVAFLDALDSHGIEDPGYWDYGWSGRLDSLVRAHGVDYGTAKWLSIFTNAAPRIPDLRT